MLLAALLWFFLPPSEPKYEGIKLSQWLERYFNNFDSEPQRNEAVEAVRHIGSNAVPCLLRWLGTSDSTLMESIEEWVDKHSPIKLPFTNVYISYHDRALMGFEILGPQAQAAIPELERRMDYTNKVGSAAEMLCRIGPAATSALLRGLTNSDPDIRSATAGAIWLRSQEIGPTPGFNRAANQPIKLPVLLLLDLLRQSDSEVRMLGLQGIQAAASQKAVETANAVPLLIDLLKDSNIECRAQAANALACFGPEATNAVPALMVALQDQAEPVRIAATNALKKLTLRH